MNIIDLGCSFPETVDVVVKTIKGIILNKENTGLANYRRIFGPQWAESLGMSMDEIEAQLGRMKASEVDHLVSAFAREMATEPEDLVSQMDAAGIAWGLLNGHNDNDKTADVISRWPTRFKGIAAADPHAGPEAVKELERAVKDLGFIAYYASPFDWDIRADDPLFYPLYAKAVDLNIPVFIYSTMNYRTDLPMDIGRPLNLDRVAMDFPKMKIVAECGGWPWVPEMVGVARRHSNIYINTCSHRPKHLATPGSGWEMLMQFGNTLLQDRIVFASGYGDLGLPLGQIVQETKDLPLKDAVLEKWLYKNAVRLFQLD
jgi:predicted TIM-barrel fold metal-dependent hydrolase